MKKSQSGFTLIELVVVIVLLGILGVTALGKFQDLSGEAEAAAIDGVASEVTAAASINYAKGVVSGTYPVTLTADNVCTTTIVGNLFQTSSFPSGYDVNEAAAGDCGATVTAGTSVSCTIFKDDDGDGVMDAGETRRASVSLICTG